MSNWKVTLVVSLIVTVFVIIGMIVFVAAEEKLSYGDSFDLCMQTITTIGYGNHVPVTQAGKAFCVFFAIVGIPINFYLLKLIGEHMLNGAKHFITKIESMISQREPRYLHEKCLVIGVVDIIVLVLIGAGIQMANSSWSFLDGIWAYVITFTTVGFGDIIPHHDSSDTTNKIDMVFFLPFYYYLGLCVISSIIQSAMGVVDSVNAIKRLFGYHEVLNEQQEGDEGAENAVL